MSRLVSGLDTSSGWAVASMVVFVVFCAFSVAYSQLAFKKDERILTLDANGWSTRIGSKTGVKRWNETVPAYKHVGAIYIGDPRGNAMIIPRRAFSSDVELDECLAAIKGWQQNASPDKPAQSQA
jgi:hypothetical protein